VMNIRPIPLIVGSNLTFQYMRNRICGYYLAILLSKDPPGQQLCEHKTNVCVYMRL
jgi:hypothetical protein